MSNTGECGSDLARRRIAVVVIGHAQWPGLEPHAHLAGERIAEGVDRLTLRSPC